MGFVSLTSALLYTAPIKKRHAHQPFGGGWEEKCTACTRVLRVEVDRLRRKVGTAVSPLRETRVCRLNAGCQNSAELTGRFRKKKKRWQRGLEYELVHPISNKVHYFPSEHTCTLLVKLTPLFGVARRPAGPNWSGVDQSAGLMERPAWPRTKRTLLLAVVLMCFLYWQQGHMTAKRGRWRRVEGSQGA